MLTALPLSTDAAHQIVRASLGHLARLIQHNGRFIYAHEAGDITATHDGYNLLRHCGTLWFMARAVNELADPAMDPELIKALALSASYIGNKMKPTPWAATDRPSLALVGNGAVKLGGLGLALLALAEAMKIKTLQPLLDQALPFGTGETITRLRQYALDEIDGDDFHHKRDFATGKLLRFRSDYYTGEAIFGLLTTGPAPDELIRVITALMRRGYGWSEQSHWMAYAACEAIERSVVSEALGAAYLTGLIEAILGDVGYRQRRQSTPIACRTEALGRALLLSITRLGLLSAELLARMRTHTTENLAMQLDWYANGQFWKGDDDRKVQIDYIQHNATAFLHRVKLDEAGI
jgi:hypothetical protein